MDRERDFHLFFTRTYSKVKGDGLLVWLTALVIFARQFAFCCRTQPSLSSHRQWVMQ